jgi:hypothetical protein
LGEEKTEKGETFERFQTSHGKGMIGLASDRVETSRRKRKRRSGEDQEQMSRTRHKPLGCLKSLKGFQ